MQSVLEKNRFEEELIDRQNDRSSESSSSEEDIDRPEQEDIDPNTIFKDITHLKSFHSSNSEEIARRLENKHPDVATLYQNLAAAYSRFGYHEEAVQLYKTLLEIRKNSLTDQHQTTIATYNRLAGEHHSLKDYEDALYLYIWSLELTEKMYGDQHLSTAALYSNLSRVYEKLDEHDTAEEFKAKCYKVIEAISPAKIKHITSSSHLQSQINMKTGSSPGGAKQSLEKPVIGNGQGQKRIYFAQESIPGNLPNMKVIESLLKRDLGDKDETFITCSPSELANSFFIDHVVVWYDPNAGSKSSSRKLALLNNHSSIRVFKQWEEVVEYVQQNTFSCQVLISGKDGEHLVKALSNNSNVLSMYTCSDDKDPQTEWTKNYMNILSTKKKFKTLISEMWKDSLKLDFPSFASVFDDKDVSHVNKINVYLRGLSVFLKRDQAKQDFVSAVSVIYTDKEDIDEFRQNYNDYDMNTVLSWYTRESFLYRMVNNCLRIATSDSILYSRLVIRDLETAIKDSFSQEKNHFSGLLYRTAYLSEQEWESLGKNVGKDVEMYGFLSTSKKKRCGITFPSKRCIKEGVDHSHCSCCSRSRRTRLC